MENLIFSLNAVMPIFLMMVLGFFFRKIGLMDEGFVDKLNAFVFKVALPLLVFEDLATVDFAAVWDTKFVLFCFGATVISILAAAGVSFLLRDKSIQGEFIQGAYRSSAAILGIAIIQNIYGDAGMGPLMIIGSVPLYNVMAVVVLTVMKPERGRMGKALVISTLKGVLTNPIIVGILLGMAWSLLRIPMPFVLEKTVSNVAVLASPLGLMAMGASFEAKQILGKWKPALFASVIKLVVLAAVFLPVAVWLGFVNDKLIAILVMLGSATTVSCYVMARNLGHEGTLTSSIVMITTICSAFTLTGWLYILKVLELV